MIHVTRRKFVCSLLGTSGLATSYTCFIEPRWLAVTRPSVRLRRAPLAEPIRILQLSDLHRSWAVPLANIESAITRGLQERPDVICLTGDYITGMPDLSTGEYTRTLSRLSAFAPTFAVMGNHDGGIWARQSGGYSDNDAVGRLLARSGIQLLHNAATRIQVRSAAFTLAGVGDLWSDEVDPRRAFSEVNARMPVVLLSHNPDSKELLENYP